MADMVLHLTEEENIVLSAAVLHRLIETKSGDACLLYLCLRQGKDAMDGDRLREKLGWEQDRFDAAKKILGEAGLIRVREETAEKTAPKKAEQSAPPLRDKLAGKLAEKGLADIPEQPPERKPQYTQEDVACRIEGDKGFAELLREVERRLGPLTTVGTQTLLELCEYLGLPYDVVYMLVGYCIRRKAILVGKGRLPSMREIEKEGYVWARKGLYSVQDVEDYLKKLQEQSEKFPDYMKALQLPERNPAPSEEKYLKSWAEMGFSPEVIAVAYDKTVFKCREFKWAYCNGILKRWHEKNLHTPEEVRSEKDAPEKTAEKAKEKEAPSRKASMKQYL